jgi:hypothetical protein
MGVVLPSTHLMSDGGGFPFTHPCHIEEKVWGVHTHIMLDGTGSMGIPPSMKPGRDWPQCSHSPCQLTDVADSPHPQDGPNVQSRPRAEHLISTPTPSQLASSLHSLISVSLTGHSLPLQPFCSGQGKAGCHPPGTWLG